MDVSCTGMVVLFWVLVLTAKNYAHASAGVNTVLAPVHVYQGNTVPSDPWSPTPRSRSLATPTLFRCV